LIWAIEGNKQVYVHRTHHNFSGAFVTCLRGRFCVALISAFLAFSFSLYSLRRCLLIPDTPLQMSKRDEPDGPMQKLSREDVLSAWVGATLWDLGWPAGLSRKGLLKPRRMTWQASMPRSRRSRERLNRDALKTTREWKLRACRRV